MMRLISAALVCLGALGCGDSTGPGSGPVILTIASGGGQEGLQNTILAQPIIVEAVRADDYGYLWWMKTYPVGGTSHASFKAPGLGGPGDHGLS